MIGHSPIIDNGLGYHATCDCEDFLYRHGQEMTQEDINSRQERARLNLVVLASVRDGNVWTLEISGTSTTHEVIVSKGKGNAGPNFVCAHCIKALFVVLEENEGWEIVAFGRQDTIGPPDYCRASVDGWLDVLYLGR
jgi:hypothetical protein